MSKYFLELKKVGNRGYTTGFALGNNNSDSYSYDISKGLAGADFLFEFHGKKKYSDVDFHLIEMIIYTSLKLKIKFC